MLIVCPQKARKILGSRNRTANMRGGPGGGPPAMWSLCLPFLDLGMQGKQATVCTTSNGEAQPGGILGRFCLVQTHSFDNVPIRFTSQHHYHISYILRDSSNLMLISNR